MQNKIYIAENNKNELIEELSKEKLSSHKFYTLTEFKKELFYNYDAKTILYLMKKYNINYQIAKIYLENLYYLEDKTYFSPKLNELLTIKKDVLTNDQLIINPLFKEFLKNQEIIFYGHFTSNDKNKLAKYLSNITTVRDEEIPASNTYTHHIYKLKDLDEEVTFVANEIVKLIKSGVSIKQIFLTNLTEEYYSPIKRIFKMFNIPVNLQEKNSIFGTRLAKEFLANLSNPLPVLTANNDLTDQLIDIYNKYIWVDDLEEVRPLIINDLKTTYLKTNPLKNAVNECRLSSLNIHNDEYLFLLNFNQGSIPLIHKDEGFLNNDDLSELGLLNCNELNKIERINAYQSIVTTKNLIITTKDKLEGAKCYISSLNEELNYPVEEINNSDFTNSHLYNQMYLANAYDNLYKYGTTSPYLDTLSISYNNLPYNTYDHSYKPINKDLLANYLKDGLTLSYSSMDYYFRCGFRYYLNSILKLNIYEDTFMQKIGTIFHEVLENSFIADTPFENLWQQALANTQESYTKKEEFFLKKLKEELKFIVETINNHNNYSDLKKELHEERIVVNYDGNIKVTFKGFIDKIKYQEYDGETVVAIIDYKTGNPELNLNYSAYGIEMQLPIYLFLAKHSPKLKNVKIAGFYLQKILNNEITSDNVHTYNELKEKNLLLQGYSNEDMDILSKFDSTYNDSKVIKSMKTSSKGFYHYTKILNTKTMDALTDLVSNKIDEAITNITNANFPINPKQIGKDNLGCEFCEYKDICFHNEKDLLKLKEYRDLEFLKEGEDNAQLD